MDSRQLRQLMEDLIAQGAENIDLVTPTHYLPTILPALTPKLPVPDCRISFLVALLI